MCAGMGCLYERYDGGCGYHGHECWLEEQLVVERKRSEKLNRLFDLEEQIAAIDCQPSLTAAEQAEMDRLWKDKEALELELA